MSSRSRGALLGLAVGDALGTTLEFEKLAAPPFPAMCAGPHREMTGAGPFDLEPGQDTDDTQMACCLAASLRATGLRFDADDAARRYVKWRRFAFDIGNQTAAALRLVDEGMKVGAAARVVWLESGKNAAGNGSLMRAAPIGALVRDESERRRAALADSSITHHDPRCGIACAVFASALDAAIGGGSPSEMRESAQREAAPAADAFLSAWPEDAAEIRAAREAILDDLGAAARPDPSLYGPELHLHAGQGFVRVALRLAFWELLHAASFEEALVDVVNRGGDADTNGAIAGALLGAHHGEEAIPIRWRESVLHALETSTSGPFRDLYHPRTLL